MTPQRSRPTRAQQAWTALERQAKAKKPSKYRNRITVVDGIRFDSIKEARRWSELRLLEKAGKIHNLTRQPAYVLAAPIVWNEATQQFTGWIQIALYYPDFEYFDNSTGQIVTEDVKSPATSTAIYRLKKGTSKRNTA